MVPFLPLEARANGMNGRREGGKRKGPPTTTTQQQTNKQAKGRKKRRKPGGWKEEEGASSSHFPPSLPPIVRREQHIERALCGLASRWARELAERPAQRAETERRFRRSRLTSPQHGFIHTDQMGEGQREGREERRRATWGWIYLLLLLLDIGEPAEETKCARG
jgi:hypothetical protein